MLKSLNNSTGPQSPLTLYICMCCSEYVESQFIPSSTQISLTSKVLIVLLPEATFLRNDVLGVPILGEVTIKNTIHVNIIVRKQFVWNSISSDLIYFFPLPYLEDVSKSPYQKNLEFLAFPRRSELK